MQTLGLADRWHRLLALYAEFVADRLGHSVRLGQERIGFGFIESAMPDGDLS